MLKEIINNLCESLEKNYGYLEVQNWILDDKKILLRGWTDKNNYAQMMVTEEELLGNTNGFADNEVTTNEIADETLMVIYLLAEYAADFIEVDVINWKMNTDGVCINLEDINYISWDKVSRELIFSSNNNATWINFKEQTVVQK